MEQPAIIVCVILGAPIAFWVLIACAGAAPVFTFHKVKLRQLPDASTRRMLKRAFTGNRRLNSEWPRENGFVPVGAFQASGLLGSPQIIAWEIPDEATWLCIYLLPDGQCQFDFVSKTENHLLTSGTTKDGHLFPPSDGNYVQTFEVSSAEQLFNNHNAALDYIAETTGEDVVSQEGEFAEAFENSIRQHGTHIRSMAFWILRIPWWYFTRRSKLHNKSVESIHGAAASSF